MVERSRLRFLAGALATVGLPALAGCVGPYYDDGPPHHHYDYYYYPHADVYFHLYTGWYYYRDRNRWYRARRLPRRIYLDRRRYVLKIQDRDPWRRHEQHRRRFPAPPPGRGRSRERDREEREHNARRHQEYRGRGRR